MIQPSGLTYISSVGAGLYFTHRTGKWIVRHCMHLLLLLIKMAMSIAHGSPDLNAQCAVQCNIFKIGYGATKVFIVVIYSVHLHSTVTFIPVTSCRERHTHLQGKKHALLQNKSNFCSLWRKRNRTNNTKYFPLPKHPHHKTVFSTVWQIHLSHVKWPETKYYQEFLFLFKLQ